MHTAISSFADFTSLSSSSFFYLLHRLGYAADSLHGDKSQQLRDRAMERFRNSNLKILVATDVASRGLDVKVHT